MTKYIINQKISICFAKKTHLELIYNLMKVEFPYIDDSLNVFEERFFDKDVTMFCAFLNDEFVGF
ncbi:MAG: hypothetical protein KAS30_01960, partial [Candidatus Diapherotrites archaeon]|nr:hypothetical protein [Candidatus Diapherotrites archaeon]